VLPCAAAGRAPQQTLQDEGAVVLVTALAEAEQDVVVAVLILDAVSMHTVEATTLTIHDARSVASMAIPQTSAGIGTMKTMSQSRGILQELLLPPTPWTSIGTLTQRPQIT
jgi:hypothetical protein